MDDSIINDAANDAANDDIIYKDFITNQDSDNENDNENENDIPIQNIVEFTNNDNIDGNTGLIYDIMRLVDDLYVYGRTQIENNFFNLASNEDFNLVYPNIYIGNYSISTNCEILKGLGITHIISAIPTTNPAFENKFKYLHIHAYDDEYQDMKMFFDETNLFIKTCLNEGGRILIHCMVGRSRSVTIFIAFLIFIIKGGFNQCIIKLDNDNVFNNISHDDNLTEICNLSEVCNLIEYKKLIENNNTNHNNTNHNNHKHSRQSSYIDSEKITVNEQQLPKLSKKEANFIIYKKQKMISDIDDIISNYNILKKELGIFKSQTFIETEESEELINNMKAKFSSKIVNHLLTYVKSHRECASPNTNFINQLCELCF